MLRRDQPHLVPQPPQPAPPVMRAAAGLQHHPARLASTHPFLELRARHLPRTNLARLRLHPVRAKGTLAQIHRNCRNLVHEKPPSSSGRSNFHFGTSMPLDREASPFSHLLPNSPRRKREASMTISPEDCWRGQSVPPTPQRQEGGPQKKNARLRKK